MTPKQLPKLLTTRAVLAVIGFVCGPSGMLRGAEVDAPRTGNPLVPGYFADPCCRKFGDTYYLYVTPDGWDVGKGPAGAWSSKDFVHWTWHAMNWPQTEFKWAPSVVQFRGKYYLYNSVPCQIWGAVADTPLGPWRNLMGENGKEMIPDQTPKGNIVLDGEAFIDSDQSVYLWYSTWWHPTVVKLKPDMHGFDGPPIQYFKHEGLPNPPKGLVERCMEAPYMFQRNGIYYLMYSDDMCQNSTYNVKYSTGRSPTGPFTYDPAKNPILATNLDGTVDGPGHHTILEDGGKVYIVYHRHDNPHHQDGAHRQTCADELVFNPDGSIAKVEPSHHGLGYLAPSTKRDTNLAVGKAATASSNAGADWSPANAADENNGTLWKAAGYSYPQWLQVDLGGECKIARCETEFQFPQVAYSYRIEVSGDGSRWQTFADRTSNTEPGCPMIDPVASPVSARFVRITMTGDNAPNRPNPEVGIWNFKVYDGVAKPDPTPVVEAGPDISGTLAFPTLRLSGSLIHATGPVRYAWTKVSGPGTVSFSRPNNIDTLATFGATGSYVLELAANDGARTGKDTLTVTITPAGDKLVHYALDATSGVQVRDTSGNNLDAFVKNGAVRGTGAVDQCVCFDGADDFIQVPPLLSSPALSIAAWVKLDRLVEHGTIFAGGGADAGTPDFAVKNDGKLHFTLGGNEPAEAVSDFSFTSATLGTWTHVAATYSSADKTVAFFVNGQPDAKRDLTSAAPADLGAGACVGGRDGGGRGFAGKLDELIVFNRPLAAAEVAGLIKTATFPKVRDALALADGREISLKAVPVTYAPVDASRARCSDSFFIQDRDGSRGLRVKCATAAKDAAVADRGVALTGTMRTDPATGDRYLECTAPPEIESAPVVEPSDTTLAALANEPFVGRLIKVPGAKIVSLASDRKSMVITDAGGGSQAPQVTVVSESGPIDTELAAGNSADITGIVCLTARTQGTILLKSFWRTNPPVEMRTYKLEAYYPFDETGGTTAADQSGHHRDASVSGTAWVPGKAGSCLRFNGTDSTATIPDLDNFPAFTLTAWANLGSLNDWQAVMHCDGWEPNDAHLSFRGGDLFFSVQGDHPVDVGSGPVFTRDTLNTWKWIAVVYDSGAKTAAFYADGKPLRTVTYDIAVAADLRHGIHLGSWGGSSRFFGGMLDEFRIYGRALKPDEIADLFKQ